MNTLHQYPPSPVLKGRLSQMARITFNLDDALAKQLKAELNQVGLTLTTFFELTVRQAIIQQRIPFKIKMVEEIPNETTKRAIVAAEAIELGLIPDDSPSFTSAKEAIKYLNNH